jgi:hypothetical protein
MIDLMVNTVMLLGIAVVSVPVLVFAVTGVMHLVYSVLDKG